MTNEEHLAALQLLAEQVGNARAAGLMDEISDPEAIEMAEHVAALGDALRVRESR